VQELQVEIDQQKRNKEVAEITQDLVESAKLVYGDSQQRLESDRSKWRISPKPEPKIC
jgi:hypothetical protein